MFWNILEPSSPFLLEPSRTYYTFPEPSRRGLPNPSRHDVPALGITKSPSPEGYKTGLPGASPLFSHSPPLLSSSQPTAPNSQWLNPTACNLQPSTGVLDSAVYPYSTLIGSLMYLSVCTRPDISQAVGALARYMSKPTSAHWSVAKTVLRYLAGTPNYGITYGTGNRGLQVYCDADYAGDIDTRRSTTGYAFILNGGAITWSSRLQPTVAASTTEAEYIAAASTAKEALWLRKLLKDLHFNIDTIAINADSQSAIKLIKNPIVSLRSKHIDVIHHFVRERTARNEISFEYIRTDNMVADALTKPVSSAKFNFCRDGMGIS